MIRLPLLTKSKKYMYLWPGYQYTVISLGNENVTLILIVKSAVTIIVTQKAY